MAEPRVFLATSDDDLAACIEVRIEVFVDEQKVPRELEVDEHDADAAHFIARDVETGRAIGAARLVEVAKKAKIGRVAVRKEARGSGTGRALMLAALREARKRGLKEAVLDAQVSALAFYEKLGFVAEGDEFMDAGIPHFVMRRPLA